MDNVQLMKFAEMLTGTFEGNTPPEVLVDWLDESGHEISGADLDTVLRLFRQFHNDWREGDRVVSTRRTGVNGEWSYQFEAGIYQLVKGKWRLTEIRGENYYWVSRHRENKQLTAEAEEMAVKHCILVDQNIRQHDPASRADAYFPEYPRELANV